MQEDTILGISLGTRLIGLVVMERNELIEWGTKSIKGAWSSDKLAKSIALIEKYIKEHQVKVVALKLPPTSRCSPGLNELHTTLTLRLKDLQMEICLYTTESLKEYFRDKAKSKVELMEKILEYIPELRSEYEKEMANLNPYHIKLFEALACTLMYSRIAV